MEADVIVNDTSGRVTGQDPLADTGAVSNSANKSSPDLSVLNGNGGGGQQNWSDNRQLEGNQSKPSSKGLGQGAFQVTFQPSSCQYDKQSHLVKDREFVYKYDERRTVGDSIVYGHFERKESSKYSARNETQVLQQNDPRPGQFNDGLQFTKSNDGLQLKQLSDGFQFTQSNDGLQLTNSSDGLQLTNSSDGLQFTKSSDGFQFTQSSDGLHLKQPSNESPHRKTYLQHNTNQSKQSHSGTQNRNLGDELGPRINSLIYENRIIAPFDPEVRLDSYQGLEAKSCLDQEPGLRPDLYQEPELNGDLTPMSSCPMGREELARRTYEGASKPGPGVNLADLQTGYDVLSAGSGKNQSFEAYCTTRDANKDLDRAACSRDENVDLVLNPITNRSREDKEDLDDRIDHFLMKDVEFSSPKYKYSIETINSSIFHEDACLNKVPDIQNNLTKINERRCSLDGNDTCCEIMPYVEQDTFSQEPTMLPKNHLQTNVTHCGPEKHLSISFPSDLSKEDEANSNETVGPSTNKNLPSLSLNPVHYSRHNNTQISPPQTRQRSPPITNKRSPALTPQRSPPQTRYRSPALTPQRSPSQTIQRSQPPTTQIPPPPTTQRSTSKTNQKSPPVTAHKSPTGTTHKSPPGTTHKSPPSTFHKFPPGSSHKSPPGTVHMSPPGRKQRFPHPRQRTPPTSTQKFPLTNVQVPPPLTIKSSSRRNIQTSAQHTTQPTPRKPLGTEHSKTDSPTMHDESIRPISNHCSQPESYSSQPANLSSQPASQHGETVSLFSQPASHFSQPASLFCQPAGQLSQAASHSSQPVTQSLPSFPVSSTDIKPNTFTNATRHPSIHKHSPTVIATNARPLGIQNHLNHSATPEDTRPAAMAKQVGQSALSKDARPAAISLPCPLAGPRFRSRDVEMTHVREVYSLIAPQCQHVRQKAWPMVKRFLKDLEAGSFVADVGCGNGRYLSPNLPLLRIGSDICKEFLVQARGQGHEVMMADNTCLPYRSAIFDGVISIGVIHHFASIKRRVASLSELARVLVPGGRVMIYVWAFEQPHRKFEGQDVLIPWVQPDSKGRSRRHLSTCFAEPHRGSVSSLGSSASDDESSTPPCHNQYTNRYNVSCGAHKGRSSNTPPVPTMQHTMTSTAELLQKSTHSISTSPPRYATHDEDTSTTGLKMQTQLSSITAEHQQFDKSAQTENKDNSVEGNHQVTQVQDEVRRSRNQRFGVFDRRDSNALRNLRSQGSVESDGDDSSCFSDSVDPLTRMLVGSNPKPRWPNQLVSECRKLGKFLRSLSTSSQDQEIENILESMKGEAERKITERDAHRGEMEVNTNAAVNEDWESVLESKQGEKDCQNRGKVTNDVCEIHCDVTMKAQDVPCHDVSGTVVKPPKEPHTIDHCSNHGTNSAKQKNEPSANIASLHKATARTTQHTKEPATKDSGVKEPCGCLCEVVDNNNFSVLDVASSYDTVQHRCKATYTVAGRMTQLASSTKAKTDPTAFTDHALVGKESFTDSRIDDRTYNVGANTCKQALIKTGSQYDAFTGTVIPHGSFAPFLSADDTEDMSLLCSDSQNLCWSNNVPSIAQSSSSSSDTAITESIVDNSTTTNPDSSLTVDGSTTQTSSSTTSADPVSDFLTSPESGHQKVSSLSPPTRFYKNVRAVGSWNDFGRKDNFQKGQGEKDCNVVSSCSTLEVDKRPKNHPSRRPIKEKQAGFESTDGFDTDVIFSDRLSPVRTEKSKQSQHIDTPKSDMNAPLSGKKVTFKLMFQRLADIFHTKQSGYINLKTEDPPKCKTFLSDLSSSEVETSLSNLSPTSGNLEPSPGKAIIPRGQPSQTYQIREPVQLKEDKNPPNIDGDGKKNKSESKSGFLSKINVFKSKKSGTKIELKSGDKSDRRSSGAFIDDVTKKDAKDCKTKPEVTSPHKLYTVDVNALSEDMNQSFLDNLSHKLKNPVSIDDNERTPEPATLMNESTESSKDEASSDKTPVLKRPDSLDFTKKRTRWKARRSDILSGAEAPPPVKSQGQLNLVEAMTLLGDGATMESVTRRLDDAAKVVFAEMRRLNFAIRQFPQSSIDSDDDPNIKPVQKNDMTIAQTQQQQEQQQQQQSLGEQQHHDTLCAGDKTARRSLSQSSVQAQRECNAERNRNSELNASIQKSSKVKRGSREKGSKVKGIERLLSRHNKHVRRSASDSSEASQLLKPQKIKPQMLKDFSNNANPTRPNSKETNEDHSSRPDGVGGKAGGDTLRTELQMAGGERRSRDKQTSANPRKPCPVHSHNVNQNGTNSNDKTRSSITKVDQQLPLLNRSEPRTTKAHSGSPEYRETPSTAKMQGIKTDVKPASKTDSGSNEKQVLAHQETFVDARLSRYYHVFKKGELDQLIIDHVTDLAILETFYDHGNWCVIAQRR